jgi:hypothetical protein
MNHNAEDPQTDNSGNSGFVWSQRLTILTGFILAAVVAVAHYAPALAAPIEWLPH